MCNLIKREHETWRNGNVQGSKFCYNNRGTGFMHESAGSWATVAHFAHSIGCLDNFAAFIRTISPIDGDTDGFFNRKSIKKSRFFLMNCFLLIELLPVNRHYTQNLGGNPS